MSAAPSPRDEPPGDPPHSVRPSRRDRPGTRVVAGVVCALEAVVLGGFCAFYVWEVARGEEDDTVRALMSALLIGLFAVALALFAGQWRRAAPWVRTPTIVWNLLLLPVAWGLLQSGRAGVGILVGAVGVAGVVAAVLAGDDHDVPDRSSGD